MKLQIPSVVNTKHNASQALLAVTAATLALSPLSTAFAGGGAGRPAPKTAALVAPAAAVGTYGVDKPHTDITFTVPHLGVSKVRGSFTDFDGTVTVDGKKPENSSVRFTIKVASIDTGNEQRDGHLKSADFFDAQTYPEITFRSSRVSKRPGGYAATGTLTIHGVSRQVVLPFTVTGPVKGMEGAPHYGVETALKIDRRDYGLTWSKLVEGTALVGNEVNIAIDLDLVKQAPAAKTAAR